MSDDYAGLSELQREQLVAAQVKSLEARAEKFAGEAANARAMVQLAEQALAMGDLKLASETRKDQEERASDKYHHVYVFDDPVGAGTVSACLKQLTQWMRLDPGCDIEIIFDSPGGSVIDGMHLFDFIRTVRSHGHHVTIVALGYAASMAGILLQAGDKRVVGREAYVLIHEISTFTGGKIAEIEDEVKFVKKIQKRVARIFVERAQGKMSANYFQTHWRRKDWWLDSDECLKLGICDEIR